jgi:hypothetical protein
MRANDNGTHSSEVRMHARMARAAGFVVGAVLVVAMFGVARASATSITEPSGSPVVAPLDVAGRLAPIQVSATGFPLRTAVYVEQCDGTSPTTLHWDPTVHCDLGSSPSAVYADANGNVTFGVSDPKHAFVPFVGESPQSLFNCLPTGAKAPSNGLPNFTDCQVRVSSNDAAVTADQQFFGLKLPANATNPPPKPVTTTTILPRAGGARAPVTTTTRPHGAASRSGSKPAAGSKLHASSRPEARAGLSPYVAASDSGQPAASSRPASDSPGLLGLSDPAVVAGYLLLLGGVALTALSVRLAPRSRATVRRAPPERAP